MSYDFISLLFNSFYNRKVDVVLERPNLNEFLSNDVIEENRNFKGTVTNLVNGEGVVDNIIYFSLKDINIFNLKIGDQVQGNAYKIYKGAWRSTDMQSLQEDWESDNEIDHSTTPLLFPEKSSVIGKVTSVYDNLICLNGNLTFHFHPESCITRICVGDWIQCEHYITENLPENYPASSSYKVKPLRQKVVHGSVSQINAKNYIINEEIYCDKKIFHSNLRLHDRVIVHVIESDNGRFSWRAINGELDPLLRVSQPCTVDLSSLMNDEFNKCNDGSKLSAFVIEDCEEDEHFMLQQNISVTNNLKIDIDGVGMTEFIIIDICNDNEEAKLLENIMIYSERQPQLYVDKHFLRKFPHKIESGHQLKLALPCKGYHLGYSVEICLLCFKDFSIERKVNINVKQRETSTCEQQRRKPVDSIVSGRIIKGEKPIHSSPFIPIKLPYAKVPEKLWNLILSDIDPCDEFPSLVQPLNFDSYIEKFSNLLFLEEIKQDMQIRKYDMPCVSFDHHGDYLALTVNGLAEKRPSLLVGDTIIASNIIQGDFDDIRYEGYIHEVLHNKVLLKFHPEFHSQYNDEDYSVQLRCNRTPLRRCHLAISLVTKQLGASIMFPLKLNFQLPQVCYIDDSLLTNQITATCTHTSAYKHEKIVTNVDCTARHRDRQKVKIRNTSGFKSDKNGYCIPIVPIACKKVLELPHLKLFNSDLNFEQRTAVKRILEGSTRPLPYIIYGPPGTGKTVTIVEAILQIFTMVPHSRILVVTPSNSASDLVAERAIRNGCLKKGDLIRIYSFNKSGCAVSEELSEFVDKENDIEVVVRHRIIVSTVTNSGILYTAKLKNGHFTHVFIDEAGQLTEPETCISLGLVNSCSGQVVLAGDPKQLGPVVMSSLAKRCGLGQSLLHRLCSSVLYQPHNVKLQKIYSTDTVDSNKAIQEFEKTEELSNDVVTFEPRLVTLLIRNYRSHIDLISVPSQLFYHGNLISCASLEIQNHLLAWPELPSPSIPLVFHCVRGENQQEGDSPSWFNPAEAFQVCRYANSLVKFGLDSSDIGIITPYKKQVEKIRKLLAAFEVRDIKVGPVEEFQGQERMAIILSTVRSTENLIEDDVQHSLGFLHSAERFNVAITRAMSLLVVVGNPFLLKKDPHWSIFIAYCIDKGVIKQ